MTVPELIEYIRQQSQAGVSAQELRETLMGAGWTEFDVENALHDVAAGLQPVTVGASIHEDLAQVRGLVAHLSTRVGRLEARLTNTSGVPMLANPEPQLPAPRRRWGLVGATLIMVLVCVGMGATLSGVTSDNATRSFLTITGAVVVVALFGWFYIRHHRPWPARFSAAMAVVLGSWSTWLAWNRFHLIEWTTALAIAVLLLVYMIVVTRWINRIERR